MFLKPPLSADKPKANRSNKGAFTNRPLPKRKPFKPPEEETPDEPSAKVSKEETGFVLWVKTSKQNCDPIFTNVYEYVLEGSPFKGDAKYGCKDQIKDAGARWMPNPMKQEGCTNRSVKRGWWAAWDDKTLLYLLSMRDDTDSPMWTCEGKGGLLVPSECLVMKTWLAEFLGEEECKRTESRVASILAHSAEPEESAPDDASCQSYQPMSPVHVQPVKYKQWPGDTFCSQCETAVWDQFLDCHCTGAVWKTCPECWIKFRTDAGAAADTLCECSLSGRYDRGKPERLEALGL